MLVIMFIRTILMSTKKSPTPKQAPANKIAVLEPVKLASLVHNLRNEKVLLDSDLAELYGVETRSLNQAVKRNIERFPEDFMFQLTDDEVKSLMSQIVISKISNPNLRFQSGRSSGRGGHRKLPYAFTEQGVAMLSSVLRSPRAVEVNIAIMRTFVQLRRLMDSNQLLAEKIENWIRQKTVRQKTEDKNKHFRYLITDHSALATLLFPEH